jgi:hypothetical protein
MRKILLTAVAITPLFGGVAFANYAHGVLGGVPPQSTLYIGNQAITQGTPNQGTPDLMFSQGPGAAQYDGNPGASAPAFAATQRPAG